MNDNAISFWDVLSISVMAMDGLEWDGVALLQKPVNQWALLPQAPSMVLLDLEGYKFGRRKIFISC